MLLRSMLKVEARSEALMHRPSKATKLSGSLKAHIFRRWRLSRQQLRQWSLACPHHWL